MRAGPLDRVRLIALAVSIAGLGGLLFAAFFGEGSVFPSYLIGFLFCWGLAGGAVAWLLLHQLVAGAWGFLIQKTLEAAAKTMPLVLLMFVPIAFGIHDLYHWSHAEAVAADPILQHKAPYLDVTFFLVRAAVYFAIWIAMAFALSRWSSQPSRAMKLAGPGLVLWVVTTTFAAFDWAMSLDPHWFSTIYGLIFVVGQALGTLALAITVLFVVRRGELASSITTDRIHDLGKLLFAFVMLWGYMNLSQLIIIWYGNLPEEIVWYVERMHGGYAAVTIALVVLQFVLPFFFLLSRRPKRHLGVLAATAAALVALRLLDLFWHVIPGELRPEPGIRLADVAAPMFLGGLWVAAFTFNLKRRPLLDHDDPRLCEAFGHDAHG